MPTDNEIYDSVHDIVATVTGLDGAKVIPADDNEDAPEGAYASIKVATSRGRRGQPNIVRSETAPVSSPIGNVVNIEHDIRQQFRTEVSIQFYRGDAVQLAALLIDCNKRPDISTLLSAASIGWAGQTAVNNLTAIQSKEQEQRAQITIFLWHVGSQKVTTNAIYTIPVAVENEDSDNLYSAEVNLPVEP